jgi:predicted amidohydrolase
MRWTMTGSLTRFWPVMRAALIQLNGRDDPAANLPVTLGFVRQAVAAGAGFVLTPELTNGLSSSRCAPAQRFPA